MWQAKGVYLLEGEERAKKIMRGVYHANSREELELLCGQMEAKMRAFYIAESEFHDPNLHNENS